MMKKLERLNAIRAMLNAPERESVKLSTGERIDAWDLCDERGNPVKREELSDDMLVHCYQRRNEWSCPAEYR